MADKLNPWRISVSRHYHYSMLLRLMVAALVAVAPCSSVYASAEVRSIIVDDQVVLTQTDRVTIRRGDNIMSVSPGDILQSGDVLTTSRNSQALVVRDNGAVEIYVQENSRIRISSIWVEIGEIYVKVKKALRERFEVESEYGVAGVEGTEFVVRVSPGDDEDVNFACITLEGKVAIRSPDDAWAPLDLYAGVELKIKAGGLPRRQELSGEEFRDLSKRFEAIRNTYLESSSGVLVPSVVGMYESDAVSALQTSGLLVGDIDREMTNEVVGQVIRQQPHAGNNVAHNTRVKLVVVAEPTRVPNLVGVQSDAVGGLLDKAKLRKGTVTFRSTGEHPPNAVIEQTPASGEVVAVGTAVDWLFEQDESARPMAPKIFR